MFPAMKYLVLPRFLSRLTVLGRERTNSSATKAGSPGDHGASPSCVRLLPGVVVEQTAHAAVTVVAGRAPRNGSPGIQFLTCAQTSCSVNARL